MPCYKCSNGKYKYGENGNCQFDTLKACQAAEHAIHARENAKGDEMAGKKKPHDPERREEPYHKKPKPKK
jgi:hypothetical protein